MDTNIPVDDAIKYTKELGEEYKDIIPNTSFISELLEVNLKNSLMNFDCKYFQQIYFVIMGINFAPILANTCMAG